MGKRENCSTCAQAFLVIGAKGVVVASRIRCGHGPRYHKLTRDNARVERAWIGERGQHMAEIRVAGWLADYEELRA